MTEPTPALNTGKHDLPVSDALREFMRNHWATAEAPAPAPHPAAGLTDKRRAAVAARFPGERLVVPAGELCTRSNDTDYPFRPHTAHAYLTASGAPDDVLIIEPDGSATLYMRPRSSRDSEDLYRDRRYGEFWVGRRPDLAEAAAGLGLPTAHLDRLPDALTGATPTRVLRGVSGAVDRLAPAPASETADAELATALAELRLVKDDWEIGELQRAVDATALGFAEVVRALPAATAAPRGERWVEGTFNRVARTHGNDVGYSTIAAAGPNACVLHWITNNGAVRPGELLLLDAGVEVDSLYTADITRTLPINGRYTTVQRDLYDLVAAAQQAGIDTLRPGVRYREYHLAAMRVLAEGLHAMGILKVDADTAMDPESGVYRRYTVHSSGHMLGMDVHDCAAARAEMYVDGILAEGHVLTVEPGLYFQPDDLTVPAELRGIGIRIEDDVLVGRDGAVVLSEALPRTAAAVEEWMAGLGTD